MKTCVLLVLMVHIVLAIEKQTVVHDVADKVVKVNNIALLKHVVEDHGIKNHLEKEIKHKNDEKIKDDLSKKVILKEKQEFKDHLDNIKDNIEAGDKKQGENEGASTFSAFTAGECALGFVKINGVCTKVD